MWTAHEEQLMRAVDEEEHVVNKEQARDKSSRLVEAAALQLYADALCGL